MPWIFGLFLVTPCALRNYHVVISKQDSTIRQLGYNRCAPERDHVMRTTLSDLDRGREAV